jgi:16S rRNA (adenine1518-N6/adenine1519-N6)-dimethyltransferase
MAGVKPKKYLGQHFLKDEDIAKDIVAALNIQPDSEIMEVGPGTGVLTKYILKKEVKKFFALDLDMESIEYLQRNFPKDKDQFIYDDFLKINLKTYFEGHFSIIGNFPYNISSQIFFKLLDHKNRVDEIVGMLQKEVAERICATHGNKVYGILSVLLQVHFHTEYLFTVEPDVFIPPPKVKSAVIRLRRREESLLTANERLFTVIVKMGFQMRRKTLRNALKGINLPTEFTTRPIFDKRAEQLSVQDFVTLTEEVSKWT